MRMPWARDRLASALPRAESWLLRVVTLRERLRMLSSVLLRLGTSQLGPAQATAEPGWEQVSNPGIQ